MRKHQLLGQILVMFLALILCFIAWLYLVRPSLLHAMIWHSEKAIQSLYMHEVKKMDIPLLSQTKNLNCESATVAMILQYYGKNRSIDDVQNALPLDENPHKGFRGNVDGSVWGFDDYGVYAEPIAKAMTEMGVPAKAYSNISEDFLKQKVLAGKPAIIWIDIANPHPVAKVIDVNGEKVKLVSGEHVAVVTGYENGTWILNDPWRTTSSSGKPVGETIEVDNLESIRWKDFDHMAVIVE